MSLPQVDPNKLSDEQIDRLLLAVKALKDTNMMAALVWTALEKKTSRIDKRYVLITSYSQSFELLLVMNMAIESKVKPQEFEKALDEQRKNSHAGPK